jgi:hypothetical protein
MVLSKADSNMGVILPQNVDHACIPSDKKYQIKASRFDNEFLIDCDNGLVVGQVKVYPQSDTSSAFIMNMNKDVVLAINVHVSSPNTAIFFIPSTDAQYLYAGQLKLEVKADCKAFTFENNLENGTYQGTIKIACSASARKFHLSAGEDRSTSFSFDNKSISVTSEEQLAPSDVPILLGIAFSASYILPFKG